MTYNIIDAGIVMNTSVLPKITGDIIIPSTVQREIKSQQASHLLEMLEMERKISVVAASPKWIQKVENEAKKMGQKKLSTPDIHVLAIALEYTTHGKVRLYSDDYGVRNVAHQLDIPSQGFTTQGGDQKRRYKYQCKACGNYYKFALEECDICGHTKFNRYRR